MILAIRHVVKRFSLKFANIRGFYSEILKKSADLFHKNDLKLAKQH